MVEKQVDMNDHSARAHAALSASSSYRWMNCPGCLRMIAALGIKRDSEEAAEGTAAHQILETCLQKGEDAATYIGTTVQVPKRLEKDEFWEFEVTEEMAEAVQEFLDYARPRMVDAEWHSELRVDLSSVYPDMFGTLDATIYNPKTRVLEIIDYKHGKGVAVDSEDNAQLLYYAIGAMIRLQNRGVKGLVLTIVQPRCFHKKGTIRTWEIKPSLLHEWRSKLVDAAKATEDPYAPCVAGPWCQESFCDAAGGCSVLADYAMRCAQDAFGQFVEPERLTPAQLQEKLLVVGMIESWCKRVREYAHHEAETGRKPDGWKLVMKRAIRKWRDEANVVETAPQLGLKKEDFFTQKLRSPAQIEKMLPKDVRPRLAELVIKESSGTTLVPDDDPRPEVRPSIETAFGDGNENQAQ